MKRILITLSFLVLVAPSALAQNDRYEKRVITYAKRISVLQLDRGLADKPFGQWFRALVGDEAKINWDVNDCGEQTGAPDIDRDFPSCVEARARLSNGREVAITIGVGTQNKGIAGLPSVYAAFVQDKTAVNEVRKLGELAKALNENAR